MIKLRAGVASGTLYPWVVQPGGISATLSRGHVAAPVVDRPPDLFVKSVCEVRKVYLAIGCQDQPGIPTINTNDLLLGSNLALTTTKEQLIGLISAVLSKKYITGSREGAEWETACKRAKKITDNHGIHRDYSTLIWARDGGGLDLGFARIFCSLLRGDDFKPELITTCNGASVFASDEDFFDINPGLFPVSEFDHVFVIAGCVSVSNTLPSGRVSNIGTPNSVKYAIGQVSADCRTDLWNISRMFPTMDIISLDGVLPTGPAYDSDSDNESITNLQKSVVVVCQAKTAVVLRNVLRRNNYLKTCDPLRSVGNSRWASFLTVPTDTKAELFS